VLESEDPLERSEFDFEALKRKILEPVAEDIRVCRLYFVEHRRAKEIGTIVGISESAVRGIIYRARQKLVGRG
jgi:DNA-directed RNA polymerase specialized sigma subunit